MGLLKEKEKKKNSEIKAVNEKTEKEREGKTSSSAFEKPESCESNLMLLEFSGVFIEFRRSRDLSRIFFYNSFSSVLQEPVYESGSMVAFYYAPTEALLGNTSGPDSPQSQTYGLKFIYASKSMSMQGRVPADAKSLVASGWHRTLRERD
ncbi:hypothetical protein LguiB_032349 [Lonicera macranthoides]